MLPLRGRTQKEQPLLLPQGKGASQSLKTWVLGPTPPVIGSVAWGKLFALSAPPSLGFLLWTMEIIPTLRSCGRDYTV